MHPRIVARCLLLAGWLAAAPVMGQTGPTVVVMDFGSFMMGAGGASVNIGKAISAMLTTEMAGRGDLVVIERDRLRTTMRENGLHARRRLEEADAVEIGRQLGARYVLHGQVMSIVDNLRLDLRVVDVGSLAVLTTVKRSDRTSDLPTVVVQLSNHFAEVLDLPARRASTEESPTPVAATVEFSRGIDAEDRGARDEALRRYEAALAIDPGHRHASLAVERLARTR